MKTRITRLERAGGGGDRLGGLLVEAGDVDVELDRQAEAPLGGGADADARRHLGAVDVDAAALADHLERRVEAGGVADREQLLGVGGTAGAAHLLGDAQVQVEPPVVGGGVAVAAVAGGVGRGGVEHVQPGGVGHGSPPYLMSGSRGRPRIRSPIWLRLISDVPPAIDMPRCMRTSALLMAPGPSR